MTEPSRLLPHTRSGQTVTVCCSTVPHLLHDKGQCGPAVMCDFMKRKSHKGTAHSGKTVPLKDMMRLSSKERRLSNKEILWQGQR